MAAIAAALIVVVVAPVSVSISERSRLSLWAATTTVSKVVPSPALVAAGDSLPATGSEPPAELIFERALGSVSAARIAGANKTVAHRPAAVRRALKIRMGFHPLSER